MRRLVGFIITFSISAPALAAPRYLAAPERDGASFWCCFNATEKGVTYGAPVSDDLCFNGYKVEADHRGQFWCYRKDAKGNAYGASVEDYRCN